MRLQLHFSVAHFAKRLHPQHGPQAWPWWRLFSLAPMRLYPSAPSTGYRCWLYTRWGAAFADVTFDRRGIKGLRWIGWSFSGIPAFWR